MAARSKLRILAIAAIAVAAFCLITLCLTNYSKSLAQAQDTNDVNFSCEIDLFNPQYENDSGDITVMSDSEACVVAPGTSNNGKISITNKSANRIEATITFKSPYNDKLKEDFPLQIKLIDQDGNYVLGSVSSWDSPAKLAGLSVTTIFEPNETKNYELPWQWPYDSSNDKVDTKYGQLAAEGDNSLKFIIAFDVEGQILYETPSSGDNNWLLIVCGLAALIAATVAIMKSTKKQNLWLQKRQNKCT